jgi:hypothetical protein
MGRMYEGDATPPHHSCEVLDVWSQASNLLVDPLGHPILGRNLVENAPVEIAPDKLDSEQQLTRVLWYFYNLVDEVHTRITEVYCHLTTTSADAFWGSHTLPARNLVW